MSDRDTHLQAAMAAYRAGDHRRAATLARDLLRHHAGLEPALALLANASLGADDLNSAIEALQQLVALRPQHSPYARALSQTFNRRGARRRHERDEAGAEEDFRNALARWSQNRDAAFNHGLVLNDLGHHQAACAAWQVAAALAPDDPETTLEFATSLTRLGRTDEAREQLSRLRADDPRLNPTLHLRAARTAEAAGMPQRCAAHLPWLDAAVATQHSVFHLAEFLARAGHLDLARDAWLRSATVLDHGRRSPGLRARIAAELVVPPVPADSAIIDAARARMALGLDTLIDELDPKRLAGCERSLIQLAWANFYLAYQGRDDRALQDRYGDLLAHCAPKLAPFDVAPPSGSAHGRRIGLVSSSFRHCTAGHYFACWPRLLAQAGYEVWLFQLGPLRDVFTETIAADAAQYRFIDGGPDDLARQLHKAECDLLIYPELGMDYRLPAVAALRLAPRQAAAWGHPADIGLPTLDAWFSCADMEPDKAEAQYRAPLRLLPGLGTDYPAPPAPPPATRDDLGLPERRRLYLLPHSLFKLHPDNDALLCELAVGDPEGRLLLFEGHDSGTLAAFRARIEPRLRAVGIDPRQHLLFLPMTSRERFLQINRVCDVMVDALHWSGGNTSIDALASGLPVVTRPGRFMRGRQSAAMLRRLGLDKLIVASVEELAATAIAIARDPERGSALRQRILANLPALFAADDVQEALGGHVAELLGH